MTPLLRRVSAALYIAPFHSTIAAVLAVAAALVWHAWPTAAAVPVATRPVPAIVAIAPPQHPAVVHVDKPVVRVEPVCPNALARVLEQVGFAGKNHQEAWAIAMRESRGRAKAISSTNDYGLFQFNKAAHSSQPWWDENKLLTREYNATVAFEMSRGGKTWYPWGLDGQGRTKATIYRSIGWSAGKINSHITAPYQKWVKEYQELPEHCQRP